MQTWFSSILEPSYMDQIKMLLKSAKILLDKHKFPKNKLGKKKKSEFQFIQLVLNWFLEDSYRIDSKLWSKWY